MKTPCQATQIADNTAQTTAGTVNSTPHVWSWQFDPLGDPIRVQIANESRVVLAEVASIKFAEYVTRRLNSHESLLSALDHDSLRSVFGSIEDSGTPEATKLWAMLQTWFEIRDEAIRKATLA